MKWPPILLGPKCVTIAYKWYIKLLLCFMVTKLPISKISVKFNFTLKTFPLPRFKIRIKYLGPEYNNVIYCEGAFCLQPLHHI